MLILMLRSRDHRSYLCYMARLKEEYGSVMEYVRDRRLGWRDLEAKGKAFEDAGMFVYFFVMCGLLFTCMTGTTDFVDFSSSFF